MPAALPSPDEADALIRDVLPRWETESVALPLAAGCVLREDITAERDQPPFARVTMDGFALASEAVARGVRRFVPAGTQPAGAKPLRLLNADSCIEVMTGAVLSDGADCVVPIEQVTVSSQGVTLHDAVELQPGTNIHARGTDARAGATLLHEGRMLEPADIAVAASAGRARLEVSRAPRIMVVSTGNELVDPGEAIEPWQIRRSNVYAVASALYRNGFTLTALDHLPDELDVLRTRLATHLATHDVLILSGGVSKGRFDYVPAALGALGIETIVQGVAQRPGKPLWFGRLRASGKPVFALPGNPVSTLACLARYVLPALDFCAGIPAPRTSHVLLSQAYRATTRFASLLPCRLEVGHDALCRATPQITSTSGDLVTLRGSQGYVELAPGPGETAAGSIVRFYRC